MPSHDRTSHHGLPGITRPGDRSPGLVLGRGQAGRPAPRLCPPGGEAVVAVDRLAVGRAEGDLGLAAAARAGGREHLTRATAGAVARATVGRPTAGAGAVAAGAVARSTTAVTTGSLAAGAAGRAATGVAELALSVELLLTGGEGELLPAVGAGKHLIRIQRRNSSRAGFRDLISRKSVRGVIVCAVHL